MTKYIKLSILICIILSFSFTNFNCGKEEEVIKIGAILPMTGQAASYGKWMKQGIEIAVDEINETGGISGKKFEVIFEDSKSDNRVGVDAANKLISIDKVKVIETTLTGVTQSIIPITERNKIILFTSATAPGLTDGGVYVFRNETNMANEVDRMIEACKNELNIKNVALLYINNAVGIWFNYYFKNKF